MLMISLTVAILVFFATVVLDFLYVIYNAAVTSGRRLVAATFSMFWHIASALVIIAYTKSAIYIAVVAAGSWIGTYLAMVWKEKPDPTPPSPSPRRPAADRRTPDRSAVRPAPRQLTAPARSK